MNENIKEVELKKQLGHLKDERDNFTKKMSKVQKKEDEEEQNFYREYLKLEHMRECCSLGDRELLQLIDEKQNLLNTMKKEKLKFVDDIKEECRKQYMAFDRKEEDIYYQLNVLQEQTNS